LVRAIVEFGQRVVVQHHRGQGAFRGQRVGRAHVLDEGEVGGGDGRPGAHGQRTRQDQTAQAQVHHGFS
jgi:threonine dehydrogenase-like Zn-dependent dehydrogenase